VNEREGFYRRTLDALLEDGLLDRGMSVLVVAGAAADAEALRAAGFEDVTISNIDESAGPEAFAPYRWSYQDAERLDFEDGSFDVAVVSAGLHHCASPHTALLEMYRVARRGLLAIESRDSLLMRLGARLRVVDDFEVTAVIASGFVSGGVRNTPVPNYVYRWTEREVEKTIAARAPYARHRFRYFRELELPHSLFAMRRNPLWGIAMRVVEPAAALAGRLFPGQANLFAFAVEKPELPRDLQPWLRLEDGEPVPDREWLSRRFRG
jgi:ubiquinone/menaquinone biosynthesis C-methylase UbiE